MGQTSLDDDLFGEAAEDLRADIDESLAAARAELPDPDAIWEADADNVLGVLNALRGAMDAGDADEHLRDARKWYAMGERADAFDDAEAIEADIADLKAVVEDIADVREQVGDVAATVPQLRDSLQAAHESGDEAADDGPAADDGETQEAASDGGEPQDGAGQATLDDE